MPTLIYALLALVAGSCIAMQASANSKFRQNIDSPLWAAYFSIWGTFLAFSATILILRPTWPGWETLRQTQWWNWIGGPLGALIVLAGASLTSKLGAAAFIALVVGGQLLSSLLLDHYGWMGLLQQSLSWGRVLGALLVLLGVICIKYL